MRVARSIFKGILVALLLCSYAQLHGKAKSADTLRITLFFNDSDTRVDRQLRDNGLRMREFEDKFNLLKAPQGKRKCITVRISPSPGLDNATGGKLMGELVYDIDLWLNTYLKCNAEDISHDYAGVDWSHIAGLIRIDKDWGIDALEIIENTPEFALADGILTEPRREQLMESHDGAAWRWLSEFVFPDMRTATITAYVGTATNAAEAPAKGQEEEAVSGQEPTTLASEKTVSEPVSTTMVAEETVAEPEPTVVATQTTATAPEQATDLIATPKSEAPVTATEAPTAAKKAPATTSKRARKKATTTTTRTATSDNRKWPLALRTNLLLPALNVGVEVPLGNRWSVAADWYYPWIFRNPDHKNCFQALALGLEGRIWLGSKHSGGIQNRPYRLTGHSIGLFAMGGLYDVEWQYKGYQGEFATIGIDYLYALRLKNDFRLEFSIGFGQFYSEARPYEVLTPGGYGYREKDAIRAIPFYGPVKGTASLVIPIKFGKK